MTVYEKEATKTTPATKPGNETTQAINECKKSDNTGVHTFYLMSKQTARDVAQFCATLFDGSFTTVKEFELARQNVLRISTLKMGSGKYLVRVALGTKNNVTKFANVRCVSNNVSVIVGEKLISVMFNALEFGMNADTPITLFWHTDMNASKGDN